MSGTVTYQIATVPSVYLYLHAANRCPRPRSNRKSNRHQRRRATVKYQLYPVFIPICVPLVTAHRLRSTRKKTSQELRLLSRSGYSFILHFLVFVLPHVFVIVFVFPVLTMTFMHFPKLQRCPGGGGGGHSGRTLAPEAIQFESPCRASSETLIGKTVCQYIDLYEVFYYS